MPDQEQRTRPAHRTLAALFALIALVLVAGGYWYYRMENEDIRQEKYQALAAVAELKAGQILQWRKERLADAGRAAKGPFFRKATADFLRDPATPGLRADLREHLRLEQEAYGYADVILLAPDGSILLAAKDDPEAVDPATKRAVEAALADRKAVLSDFHRCAQGIVHVDAAAAMLDADGRTMALFVLSSDAARFLYPLIQSWPTPSLSAETLLVCRDGEELVYLNDLRHRAKTALSLREPLGHSDLPAVQAVLGKRGLFEGKDYRGVKVLADLRPIPGTPWFMVAKVDTDEILVEARYRAVLITILVIVFVVLAGAVIAVAYRQRQAGLYRALYQAEREQREAQEGFRTTLYSIGDAVISTDKEGRVREMNPVAEQLTGWPEAEARGKPLGEVFRIINEETRAVVEDPVQRVLREGAVVGLANHTVLIARDGTERPVADSGAPVRDESGSVTGVVLVFRDQTEERAAQEALQESEAKYRNLAENLNEVIYRADPDTWVCTYVNGAVNRIYGYAVEEWSKDPALWERAIHPEDKERVLAWFTEGHRTMESGVVQYRIIRKDKTVRWVEDHASWEKDEHGNAVSLNGVLYDITERKRAEDALARSEAILRAVFEGAMDGILVADAQAKRFVVANEAICRMLGYSHDEIMTLGVQDIHPAGDLAHVVEQFDRQMRGEISLAADMPMRRKDGSVFYADINATSVDLVGRPCVIGVFRDITERRKAEAALALSSQQWQDTFDALDDLVFVLGADRRILQVNRAMRETFPGIDLVGRKCHEIIHGTDTPFPGCPTCTVLQTGQPVRVEMQNAHLGNRWFDVQAYPIRDAARSVQQLVHVFRDITERKKAEAEIIAARREAEAANEAKSTFLANMSHEIRTPLTAILGYAELMTDRGQSAQERDEAVLTIQRNGKHLLGLINDILDLSKIEAGKVELSLSRCSIPAVIAEVVSMLRARCSQAGLPLGVEYGGEFPETILADEARVRQVLVNLAGNAVKFTEKGGVRIVASFLREWRDGRPGVRIDVIDTGIGIAADDLARLAEPFVQVNPSVSRKRGGTGLGLAISRRLVEIMGGDFEVKSQLGRGSTFSFSLPTGPLEGVAMLKNPTEVLADDRHSGRAAAAPVSLAGVHLLLAEDGADNQRLIRTILEKAGASVVVAGNGREALDRALGESFRVVLMDMQMPEMDGYTATRLLREKGFSGPIIALTAHALAGDRGRCMAAGCSDYLVKPMDRARLIAAVAVHAGLEVQADRAEPEPSISVAAAAGGGDEIIRSEFADDPDLVSVIDGFIDGLATHVGSMEDALKRGQLAVVEREAHQLKGAGGSYGYPSLTNAARIVEEAARAGDGETVAAAVGAVKKLCGAIARGRRQDVVSKELGHEGADH